MNEKEKLEQLSNLIKEIESNLSPLLDKYSYKLHQSIAELRDILNIPQHNEKNILLLNSKKEIQIISKIKEIADGLLKKIENENDDKFKVGTILESILPIRIYYSKNLMGKVGNSSNYKYNILFPRDCKFTIVDIVGDNYILSSHQLFYSPYHTIFAVSKNQLKLLFKPIKQLNENVFKINFLVNGLKESYLNFKHNYFDIKMTLFSKDLYYDSIGLTISYNEDFETFITGYFLGDKIEKKDIKIIQIKSHGDANILVYHLDEKTNNYKYFSKNTKVEIPIRNIYNVSYNERYMMILDIKKID